MSTTREKIEVMEAFERGNPVQGFAFGWSKDWFDIFDPEWDWRTWDYRIKSKPLEGWVNVYEDGYWSQLYDTLKDATRRKGRSGRTVHMREVRDE